MLKIDVPAPTKEDERDVKGQRNRRNLDAGTEDNLRAAKLTEEIGAVPDEQEGGGHDGPEYDPVVARTIERRSAPEGETAREHKG